MKKLAALLVLVLASVALVACGGSSDNTSSTSGGETTSEATTGGGEAGGGSVVELEAASGTELAYTSDEATAKAGKVTIDFKNPQAVGHDVAIEDSSGKTIGQTDVIEESATTTTVDLKPGTYHYYCTIPGHREAGMEGTLVVK